MRFFSPISLICSWSLISRANCETDYCSALCEEDPQCDHTKGSYCKSWLGPQICFAYYFETAEKHGPYYYHAEHDSKDTSTPMLCTDAEAIITSGTDYCRLLMTALARFSVGPKSSTSSNSATFYHFEVPLCNLTQNDEFLVGEGLCQSPGLPYSSCTSSRALAWSPSRALA